MIHKFISYALIKFLHMLLACLIKMPFYSETNSIKSVVISANCSVYWGCECIRSFFYVTGMRFGATVNGVQEELFFWWPWLRYTAHESISCGHIALNAIQRRHAKVSTTDSISVSRLYNTNLCFVFQLRIFHSYLCCGYCFRFILPDNFELALLTLELEFLKKGDKNEQVYGVGILFYLGRFYVQKVYFYFLFFSYCRLMLFFWLTNLKRDLSTR